MTGAGSGEAAFEHRLAQAFALHEAGRLDEAEMGYRSILAADPGCLQALLHLGVLRLQQGRPEEAVELTRRALQRDPGSAEAHSNLAAALHFLGRHDEAVAACEAGLAIDPDRAEAHYGLGLALHALGRAEEAVACYERALVIDPDYAEAGCALGAALAATGLFDQALRSYQRALVIDPDYVEAMCGAAEAQRELKAFDRAIAGYRGALALRPDHAEAHHALGIALQAAGRHGEAVAAFRSALGLVPDYGAAQLNLGIALEEMGFIDDAHAAFERAVAIDPENIRCTFSLVASRRVRCGDPALAALREWEARLEMLSERERILAHFALGKAFADIDEERRSFDHLLAGNALKRRTIRYDESATLGAMTEIAATFTSELIAGRRGGGDPSPRPIFIVGMPRSGSTLVEQILASHPRVFGGGERADFAETVAGLGLGEAALPFPAGVASLGENEPAQLGARYLERLAAAARAAGADSAQRVTDKMPGNFCFAGLIHLALPNARIIHTRRDPVDTCLSCFSRLFAAEQPFAYDLGELGRYCRAEAALMQHWRSVLPPHVLLDLDYEQLVGDFEVAARRLVAFCGLPWDPACLSFHKTERVVRTASAAQVRQPIYRSSVGRWRPDTAQLAPLLAALGIPEAGSGPPSGPTGAP